MDSHLRLGRKGSLTRILLWFVPVSFAALLFYAPIAAVISRGLNAGTLQTLAEPRILEAIWFTLWQALLSLGLCLIAGLPLAFALYRRTFRGASLFRNLLLVPFVLPSIVVAIALQPVRTLPVWLAIVIANVFLNLGIVVRNVGVAWASLDQSQDDAAELDGASTWTLATLIHLPQLRKAIASASALVFLYCITSFAIVLLFGGGFLQSIETETYFSVTQRLDLTTASALAIVQAVFTLLAFAIAQQRVERKLQFEISAIRKLSRRIAIPIAVLLSALFVIPLGAILLRGFSSAGLAGLATQGQRNLLDITVWQAAGNSLRNAIIVSIIATGLGVLVTRITSRRHRLRLFWLAPMGISSVMLGLGYLLFFSTPPLQLRASWLVLPLIQAVLAIPLVVSQLSPDLDSLPSELAEAAATEGAGAWRVWWQIEFPLLTRSVRSAAAFAFLVSIGEFGSATLLSFGDQATLPVVLFRLISRPGTLNYSMALSASALLIVLVVICVAIISSDYRTNSKSMFSLRSRAVITSIDS